MRCGECDRRAIDGACGRELQSCDVDDWALMPVYDPGHVCHMSGHPGVRVSGRWKDKQGMAVMRGRDNGRWTEIEEAVIVALYPTHAAETIASLIGRTTGAVYAHAAKLGVRAYG